jgi:hypothetical protein
MEPTLHEGDRLLVRYAASPAPGRLAVVRLPAAADGQPRPVAVKRLSGPRDGGWWVERDNPDEGVDSWLVGAVPADDILAVVLARLWPGLSLLRRRPPNSGRDAATQGRR